MNDLDQRAGLPPHLRVLYDTLPRGTWEQHENFGDLVRLWLDRHGMFRELLRRMKTGSEARLDGNLDPERHRQEIGRYGNMLLGELHGHHQIEDHHYFPRLVTLDNRLEDGFELLDSDHHALDGHMQTLAETANAYLTAEKAGARDAAGSLHGALGRFEVFLDRHLTDEEDLIMPVLLKHNPAL